MLHKQTKTNKQTKKKKRKVTSGHNKVNLYNVFKCSFLIDEFVCLSFLCVCRMCVDDRNWVVAQSLNFVSFWRSNGSVQNDSQGIQLPGFESWQRDIGRLNVAKEEKNIDWVRWWRYRYPVAGLFFFIDTAFCLAMCFSLLMWNIKH